MKHCLTVFACLGALLAAPLASAQTYPDRPIKLIVPYAPGGAVDGAARALGAGMTARLHQTVLVENKPGASGAIGAMAAASAAPDGYTFFMGNADTQVLNPLVMARIRYKAVDGFEPVGEVGRIPMVMVIRNGLNVQSASDLIKMAKDKPGSMTFGTWGIGSSAHLAMAMLEQQSGIDLNHISYQGAAPIYNALMGGFVDMTLAQVSWAQGAAKDGKVQILGVTSAKRTTLAPIIPTMAEIGFNGYVAEQWVGVYAPKGTPPAMLSKFGQELNAWLATPEGRQQLQAVGIEATGGSPVQLAERQRVETAGWSQLIKQKNIHVAND